MLCTRRGIRLNSVQVKLLLSFVPTISLSLRQGLLYLPSDLPFQFNFPHIIPGRYPRTWNKPWPTRRLSAALKGQYICLSRPGESPSDPVTESATCSMMKDSQTSLSRFVANESSPTKPFLQTGQSGLREHSWAALSYVILFMVGTLGEKLTRAAGSKQGCH